MPTVSGEIVGRFCVPSSFRRVTRETANDVHQLVTGVGRVAVAFRVGSQSDPGGAA